MFIFLYLIALVAALRPNLPIKNRYPVQLTTPAPKPHTAVPNKISNQKTVNDLLTFVNEVKTTAFLTRLTQFPERYYKSSNGVVIFLNI